MICDHLLEARLRRRIAPSKSGDAARERKGLSAMAQCMRVAIAGRSEQAFEIIGPFAPYITARDDAGAHKARQDVVCARQRLEAELGARGEVARRHRSID